MDMDVRNAIVAVIKANKSNLVSFAYFRYKLGITVRHASRDVELARTSCGEKDTRLFSRSN